MYVYNIKHKRNLFIVIVNVCVNLIGKKKLVAFLGIKLKITTELANIHSTHIL